MPFKSWGEMPKTGWRGRRTDLQGIAVDTYKGKQRSLSYLPIDKKRK
jgi:hypothetical protein